MEKQYTQDKNEKLNAKKADLKDAHHLEIKKAEIGKEMSSQEIDALAGVAPTNVPEELTKEAVAEGYKEAKKEETKTEEKKKDAKKISKKSEAIMRGNDLKISKKHSMAICDFIRGKEPERMIPELEKVAKLKMAIPMKGEIPHRKGKMMSGRYPVNACKVFIKLLKTLNANASVNGIENPIIAVAIANDASRPFKRGGSARFKRTNVVLIAREKIEKINMEKKK